MRRMQQLRGGSLLGGEGLITHFEEPLRNSISGNNENIVSRSVVKETLQKYILWDGVQIFAGPIKERPREILKGLKMCK